MQMNLFGSNVNNEKLEKEIEKYELAIEEYKFVLKQKDRWKAEWFVYNFKEIGLTIEEMNDEIEKQIDFCKKEIENLKNNCLKVQWSK